MPLPIGHSLISAGVYAAYKGSIDIKQDIKEISLFVFMGLLPDVDFVTLPFTGFGAHRGVTHSFAFAFVAATVAFAIVRTLSRQTPARLWGFLFLTAALHPVCDFFTHDFLVERGGVELFYPFSLKYYESPYPVFSGIELRYLNTIFSLHTLLAIVREAIVSGAVLAVVLYLKRAPVKTGFSFACEKGEESRRE